jgi:hypothetical protein
MNKLLILFTILLVGIVLCNFLGGNCYTEGFTNTVTTITGVEGKTAVIETDTNSNSSNTSNIPTFTTSNPYDNYNHYDKSTYPTKFYGPNGTTASVLNKDGKYSLVITDTTGKTTIYSVDSPSTDTVITQALFYGPNGGTAKITKDNFGNYIINVMKPDGTITIYTVTTTQGQTLPPPSEENISCTKSTYSLGQNYSSLNNGGSCLTPGNDYSSSLPKGISKNMIPPGQEDLYILKSQVVPPVCPACPACSRGISSGSSNSGLTPGSQGVVGSNSELGIGSASSNRVASQNVGSSNITEGLGPTTSTGGAFLNNYSSNSGNSTNYMESTKCPPCAPCARCPEPAFDCKKVPNYNSINNSSLPMPVLSDFSNFGM